MSPIDSDAIDRLTNGKDIRIVHINRQRGVTRSAFGSHQGIIAF